MQSRINSKFFYIFLNSASGDHEGSTVALLNQVHEAPGRSLHLAEAPDEVLVLRGEGSGVEKPAHLPHFNESLLCFFQHLYTHFTRSLNT